MSGKQDHLSYWSDWIARNGYDVALDVNTFGVLHVLSFAQKCLKLEILVHISTAYVCGEMAGLILEDFSSMAELVKKSTKSDVAVVERNIVEEKLKKLKAQDASEKVITNWMKDLGIARAKSYGWPNTYVFTKAMTEIYLGHSKGNIPVTIIRPTVVTSTYMEPFPGWIQGLRIVDSVIGRYWKGDLTCLPIDPKSALDMIPVDMLVLKFLNKEFDQYFRDVYVNYNRKLISVMRLVELYRPYMLFKGIFDDSNSEVLRRMASEKYRDAENFNFDPTCIDWEDYFMCTHIPGLWKHVMTKQSQSQSQSQL